MFELGRLIDAVDRALSNLGDRLGLPPQIVDIIGLLLAATVLVAFIAVLVLSTHMLMYCLR